MKATSTARTKKATTLLSEMKTGGKSAQMNIPEGAVLLIQVEGNQTLLEKSGMRLVDAIRARRPARKGQKTALDFLKEARDGR